MYVILNRLVLFVLLATMVILLGASARFVASQASNDPTTLSYQAFGQLSKVYQSGGQTMDLVAKVNSALGMIQEARMKRAQGNTADAMRLEDGARSIIHSVLAAIPAAQEQARSDSASRELTVAALIPVVVVLSTLIFYAALRTWRYYERLKLYEMRIVEKKTEG